MTLRIKALLDSRERWIPPETISGEIRRREIIEISSIVNDRVILQYEPLTNSEIIAVNGVLMASGVNYDYTITNSTVVFNSGVLTQNGHVLINYTSY